MPALKARKALLKIAEYEANICVWSNLNQLSSMAVINMWPIIQPDRGAIQEYKYHKCSVLLMHQKRDMWAGTSLTVCCLSWPLLWWASSIGKRSLSDPIRGERLCLCGPFCNLCALWTMPCTGDLLRDVLGPNMSQAGLLEMKPCWQKGLAATEREKQEVTILRMIAVQNFDYLLGKKIVRALCY